MNAIHEPSPSAWGKKPVAPRHVVAALARLASDLDTLKAEFTDLLDRAWLADACVRMHEVAESHNDAGGYGVYAVEHMGDEVPS